MKVFDFFKSINDNDQKMQVIQTLLNDKCFIPLSNWDSILHLTQDLTRAQLESIINDNSSPENMDLYRKIQLRSTYLIASEGPEGFMKSLESSTELNVLALSTRILKKLMQLDTKNMERLLTISENQHVTQPKFAFTTLKACLEANQPE